MPNVSYVPRPHGRRKSGLVSTLSACVKTLWFRLGVCLLDFSFVYTCRHSLHTTNCLTSHAILYNQTWTRTVYIPPNMKLKFLVHSLKLVVIKASLVSRLSPLGRGEHGTFYHVCNVKGKHEVITCRHAQNSAHVVQSSWSRQINV